MTVKNHFASCVNRILIIRLKCPRQLIHFLLLLIFPEKIYNDFRKQIYDSGWRGRKKIYLSSLHITLITINNRNWLINKPKFLSYVRSVVQSVVPSSSHFKVKMLIPSVKPSEAQLTLDTPTSHTYLIGRISLRYLLRSS